MRDAERARDLLPHAPSHPAVTVSPTSRGALKEALRGGDNDAPGFLVSGRPKSGAYGGSASGSSESGGSVAERPRSERARSGSYGV
ncbi:hypothetical protein HDU99_004860, partial [Rhizoclosmatium hyalinum]